MAPEFLTVTCRDATMPAALVPKMPRPGWLVYVRDDMFVRPAAPLERDAGDTGWVYTAPEPWSTDQLAGRGPAADFAATLQRRQN